MHSFFHVLYILQEQYYKYQVRSHTRSRSYQYVLHGATLMKLLIKLIQLIKSLMKLIKRLKKSLIQFMKRLHLPKKLNFSLVVGLLCLVMCLLCLVLCLLCLVLCLLCLVLCLALY